MFNPLTEKLLIVFGSLVLAAALTASAVNFVPAASAQSEAATQTAPKVRTVDIADCTSKSWPHYEPRCLIDRRGSGGAAKPVRVIAIR